MSETPALWSRVYLTPQAAAMFPRLQGRMGEVVRHSRDGLPVVKWFGGGDPRPWAVHMLQDKPASPAESNND